MDVLYAFQNSPQVAAREFGSEAISSFDIAKADSISCGSHCSNAGVSFQRLSDLTESGRQSWKIAMPRQMNVCWIKASQHGKAEQYNLWLKQRGGTQGNCCKRQGDM